MKKLTIAACLALLAGCAAHREVRLTSEPSIERAFDLIGKTPDGRSLLKFLAKGGARLEYSNTAGLCHRLDLKRRTIYLPPDYKGSDLMLALAAARAGYIYRLYAETGLEEPISEEEELAALFQARMGLELGVTEADFDRARGAGGIKTDLCSYVLEGQRDAMRQARKEALSSDPECGRPLETLESQRVWLEKTRQAINDETFYQLLYERDLARVRKGAITMNDAMKNDAVVRAMPVYEVYRYQRTFYDKQSDMFSGFEKAYAREVKRDGEWRESHRQYLDAARDEFSACGLK